MIYDENLAERRKLEGGYKLFRGWATERHPELLSMLAKDPIPQNDAIFSPLLVADMLAWNAHRDHVEAVNGREHTSEAWAALRALRFCADETWDMVDAADAIIQGKARGSL